MGIITHPQLLECLQVQWNVRVLPELRKDKSKNCSRWPSWRDLVSKIRQINACKHHAAGEPSFQALKSLCEVLFRPQKQSITRWKRTAFKANKQHLALVPIMVRVPQSYGYTWQGSGVEFHSKPRVSIYLKGIQESNWKRCLGITFSRWGNTLTGLKPLGFSVTVRQRQSFC